MSDSEFFEKLKSVETILAKRQGLKRGWLTYTELVRLLPSFSIARQILNASVVLALSYAAGVITIATGFFLASQVPGTSLSLTRSSKLQQISTNSGGSSSGQLNTATSDLGGDGNDLDPETELDYLLEDVNESINRYEVVANCTAWTRKKTSWAIPILYLNKLLQSKCKHGLKIGIHNGAMLTNYLDDTGGKKKSENLTQLLVDLGPKTAPSFLFPSLWFKYI